jgi:hypothetical protein
LICSTGWFASREALRSESGEVEKRADGVFQQSASPATLPGRDIIPIRKGHPRASIVLTGSWVGWVFSHVAIALAGTDVPVVRASCWIRSPAMFAQFFCETLAAEKRVVEGKWLH